MASCKDCICYEIICQHTLQDDELQLCNSFRNNADFVEVVRCEKCKHRTKVTECDNTLHFCRKKQNYIKLDDFCSYGERRDT